MHVLRGPQVATLRGVVSALVALATSTAFAATITVNSTADVAVNDGQCTLREAIIAANNNAASGAMAGECAAGQAFPTVDTINFNIADAGLHTIVPTSALPTISGPTVINGYSQGVASPNTLAAGNDAVLLIELNGNGLAANGLVVDSNGSGSTIRGLVINRFNAHSILLIRSNGNLIEGNFIGTDAGGTGVFANPGSGILITVGADNTIGGTSPGSRNIISGRDSGVAMGGFSSSTASSNSVLGNYIGTDKTGTIALGNTLDGIGIGDGAPGNTVGGTAPGAGNLISGNGQHGIHMEFNLNAGFAPNNNLVQGNFIGTDVTGTLPLGNGLDGIQIGKLSDSQTIGGTAPGAGNRIAFNGGRGISTSLSTGNSILGNSIFSNGGLGIDLSGNGVTANDPGDGDAGDNNLQNFPVLSSVSIDGGNVLVSGSLNSTASTTFRLEFFANTACDASGFGEGRTFLGASTVTTDAGGDVSFNNLSFPATGGPVLTATATVNPNPGVFTVTSEFSACATVAGIDIDGSKTYDALTDGLLIIRYLFGLTGPSLTSSAIGPAATRTTPEEIKQYLDFIRPLLDVDGNAQPDALTDGLMIIRYLFGVRGDSIIGGAVGPGATRTTAAQIESYIQSLSLP